MRSLVTMGLKDSLATLAATVTVKRNLKLDNESPLITDDLREMLVNAADLMGINFNETGYTYDLSFKPNAQGVTEFTAYGPDVSNFAGEACVNWGKQHQPILNITSEMRFVMNDKRVTLDIGEQYGDTVSLPVKLKDYKGDPTGKLNQLLVAKSPELHDYFKMSFGKVKLVDLPLNEKLPIVSAFIEDIMGDEKLCLVVKGHGNVLANKAISDLGLEPEEFSGMYLKCLGHYTCKNKKQGVSVAVLPANAPDINVTADMLMGY